MRKQIVREIKNVDKLANIIFLHFIEYADMNISLFSFNMIKYNLSHKNLLGWFLLDNDDNIVGYILGNVKTLVDGRTVYFISYLYIIEKYQNYGLSTQLLEIALEYIKTQNVPFVMTLCNKEILNKYKLLGFIEDPIEKLDNPNFIIVTYFL